MSNLKKFEDDVYECIALAMQPPQNLAVGNITSVLLNTAVSFFREQNEISREKALTSAFEFLTAQKN